MLFSTLPQQCSPHHQFLPPDSCLVCLLNCFLDASHLCSCGTSPYSNTSVLSSVIPNECDPGTNTVCSVYFLLFELFDKELQTYLRSQDITSVFQECFHFSVYACYCRLYKNPQRSHHSPAESSRVHYGMYFCLVYFCGPIRVYHHLAVLWFVWHSSSKHMGRFSLLPSLFPLSVFLSLSFAVCPSVLPFKG